MVYEVYGHGEIADCYNTASIVSSGNAAGIEIAGATGIEYGSATQIIQRCYNSGSITARDAASGILFSGHTWISQCYNTGNICSSTDDVSLSIGYSLCQTAAGIAYQADGIDNCYNTGSVMSRHWVRSGDMSSAAAGIIALGGGAIECYNSGDIYSFFNIIEPENFPEGQRTGNVFAGGITTGYYYAATNCAVMSNSIEGQLEVIDPGNIYANYITADGTLGAEKNNIAKYGIEGNAINDADRLLNAEKLMEQRVYEEDLGWDFDKIWKMPEYGGYPILQWQSEITDHTLKLLSVSLPSNAIINGKTVTANLSSDKTITAVDVVVANGVNWALYSDSECTNEILNISLNFGENRAYIKLTAPDKEPVIYTIIVIREEPSKPNINTDDTWSFKKQTKKIDRSYYERLFGKATADTIENIDNGTKGQCYGMVVSAININQSFPSVSSFASSYNTLSQVEQKDISFDLQMTAEDYIKYGYISKYLPIINISLNKNLNNLQELYNAVVLYENGYGPCVNICVHGSLDNKKTGHALWGISVEDYSGYSEISVYDCNYPEQIRKLILYKQDGIFTSWEYTFRDAGFLGMNKAVWGTGKSAAWISFDTNSNVFSEILYKKFQ